MSAEKPKPQPPEAAKGRPSPAATEPSAHDIFDVVKIRSLVELMKEFDLNQMELRQGAARIELRRGGPPVVSVGGAARPLDLAAAAAAPAKPAAPAAPPPASEEHIALIRSPMVGTFYAAADPESPAYVKVGDHVGAETTVCIVEAMKVFNEIPAEVSGKIVTVLVENGEPVEFNQPLFKVDTRG